jgi:hypothetical protein
MSTLLALRGGAVVLLALVLYVASGELVQAWIGLHIDAWRERPTFSSDADHAEWLRVAGASEGATQLWPWKASLQQQAARVQLYALRGNFRRAPDIGEAMLAAVDSAVALGAQNGDLLLLEARGCLLVGDVVGVEDAVLKLRRVSPHGRSYWQRMRRLLALAAQEDPALIPVADDVNAYYENWLLPRRGDAAQRHRRTPASAVPARPATAPGSG